MKLKEIRTKTIVSLILTFALAALRVIYFHWRLQMRSPRFGSFTFTGDFKVGKKDGFVKFMFRPEIRFDASSAPFFSRDGAFRSSKQQFTAGISLVAYF